LVFQCTLRQFGKNLEQRKTFLHREDNVSSHRTIAAQCLGCRWKLTVLCGLATLAASGDLEAKNPTMAHEETTMTLPRPLAGVRVLDFTWVRAGPWATRWLGAFGAEILKIEWPERPDTTRVHRYTTPPDVAPGPNVSGQFNDTNATKLGLTLNVRTPRGLELIKRLLTLSDIVIENFSSRVMQNWGLSYAVMQSIRPDIIYVSMAGFGHTGRHHHYTTMGPSAQALSGLTFLSGLPGQPPAGWGWSYLDDTGGMYGAMCALTALRHRNATGKGQYVDLSQMTAGITLNGPAFLDRTVNGRTARRADFPPGNCASWPGSAPMPNYRGPIVAPHNAYRSKGGGYNDWCVIACFSDTEWQSLVRLMGSPAWAVKAKFAGVQGRLQYQEELDQGIEAWTQTLEKYVLTDICQAAGVRAMPVQSAADRVQHDPQLQARGLYSEMEHAVLGKRLFQGVPFRLSKSPAAVHRPAPLLGQHTREVLEQLLGLSLDEIRAGYTDGTLWPKSMPIPSYVQETLQ
jgi:crotonobetainyl-CoA:carnitine CoA-transferase CaiB-like acyl-CoA transferase